MNISELIGKIVTLLLKEELYGERGVQTEGTARFTIDCLSAEHTAAAYNSGLLVTAAPTSRPPLLPPRMARRSGSVHRSAVNHSAAAAKSSKTFSLWSRIPERCHASPSSLPPRRLAMA